MVMSISFPVLLTSHHSLECESMLQDLPLCSVEVTEIETDGANATDQRLQQPQNHEEAWLEVSLHLLADKLEQHCSLQCWHLKD